MKGAEQHDNATHATKPRGAAGISGPAQEWESYRLPEHIFGDLAEEAASALGGINALLPHTGSCEDGVKEVLRAREVTASLRLETPSFRASIYDALSPYVPTHSGKEAEWRQVDTLIKGYRHGVAVTVTPDFCENLRLSLPHQTEEDGNPRGFRIINTTELGYTAPPFEFLADLLHHWHQFLLHDRTYSKLEKIAIAQGFLELVVPFTEQNSVFARLATSQLLYLFDFVPSPIVGISAYTTYHAADHKAALGHLRQTKTFDQWVPFCLTAIRDSAAETAAAISAAIQFNKKYLSAEKLEELGGRKNNTEAIVRELLKQPVYNVNDLADQVNTPRKGVGERLNSLVEQGEVEEITGRERDRIFAFKAFIDTIHPFSVAA